MPRQTSFQGIPIYIEFEEGDFKPNKDNPLLPGFRMLQPYGFFNNTLGNEPDEGQELDVFLGWDEESNKVFVVPLNDPADLDTFMEYKIIVGFPTFRSARIFAERQYFPEMIGPIMQMTVDELKDWLDVMRPKADKILAHRDEHPGRLPEVPIKEEPKRPIIEGVPKRTSMPKPTVSEGLREFAVRIREEKPLRRKRNKAPMGLVLMAQSGPVILPKEDPLHYTYYKPESK